MIPLNDIKLIGLSFSLCMLAACGDSKISAVKDTRLGGDEFTIGETLSKVKECKSTDWSSEIVNNSTVVTHICAVKLDDELLNASKKGELAALKTRAGLANISVTTALSQARSAHAEAVRFSQERSTQWARRVAEVDKRIEYIATEPRSQFISINGTALRRGEAPPDAAAWEARRSEHLVVANGEKEKLLAEIEAEKQKAQAAIDAALKQIDDATAWNEKYAQEIQRTYEVVAKEVGTYYDKSHTLKVKTTFRYREGGNAEPVSAALFIDDLEGRSAMPVYLMDPKRMREYLTYLTKNGMGMEAPRLFDERFPIENISGPDGGFRYKSSKPAT
ncbi:hypothetical protein [Variovorax boronicumulans]|uniref:hypothetical protein n=1 Tax=Variovorax boronicumulans TaxID=436515 RepID=UPI0012E580C9|nr:hypothetical protein [Variovorax boronicumulans]GER13436.1 hypothetical protein VHAB30_46260 [Variovorax boronicumulans]